MGEWQHLMCLKNTGRHHVVLTRKVCQAILVIRDTLLSPGLSYSTRWYRWIGYLTILRYCFVLTISDLVVAPSGFGQWEFLKLSLVLPWSRSLVFPFLPSSHSFFISSCPSIPASSGIIPNPFSLVLFSD